MPVNTTTFTYWDTDIQTRFVEPVGENEISYTRIIVKKDGSRFSLDSDASKAVTEFAIPAVNAAYVTPPYPTGMTWETTARCRSVQLTQMDNKAVKAEIKFTTSYVEDPSSTVSGTLVLPSQMTFSTRQRMAKVYRTGWSVAPSNTNASSDIGGSHLKGGPDSVAISIPQVAISLRFTQDASTVSMAGSAMRLGSYMGCLNEQKFITSGGSGQGFPIGSVLCESVSVQKTHGEYYDVQFEFLYDQAFHLEQVATTDSTGKTKLTSGVPTEVKWKRMARPTANFEAIYNSDTSLKTRTEKGWWI